MLCDHCSEITVAPGQATRVGKYLGGKTKMFAATGCGVLPADGVPRASCDLRAADFNDELRDVVLKEPTVMP